MIKRMLRMSFIFSLVAALTLGLVPARTMAAAAPEAPATEGMTVEQILLQGTNVIVGCGQCEPLVVTDIPICPPIKTGTTPTIVRSAVIDNVQICADKVLVDAHVDKLITWTDTTNTQRMRVVRIPVDCCIPIPGVRSTDTVAFRSIVVECERDEVQSGGTIIHEKMCVRINVSIQRHVCGLSDLILDDPASAGCPTCK